MTRPTDPEVTVEFDKPRKLRLDFNALILIEESLGINLMTEELDLGQITLRKFRDLLYAMMVGVDDTLTPDQVGRFIHPGNMGVVLAAVQRLQVKALGGKAPKGRASASSAPAKDESSTGSDSGPSDAMTSA